MMQPGGEDNLAGGGAQAILNAFRAFQDEFHAITRRARSRFETRDWHAVQADSVERLDLYKRIVDRIVQDIQRILADRSHEKAVWAAMKNAYLPLISGLDDLELAETFFNSITRRIFATVGVDPNIEFIDSDLAPAHSNRPVFRAYYPQPTTAGVVRAILADYAFDTPYCDLDRDAWLAAEHIDSTLGPPGRGQALDRIEMALPVFYRNKAAYLVGRICRGPRLTPLVLALLNTGEGIVVDAVLLTEGEASIVFSFTRSYFHVDTPAPHELVGFLKSIMPRKRVAELYISIGYNKHGKTCLYRDLLTHLRASNDKFEIAPGEKGMVMVVFTMPSYDMVFKVIRDRFPRPKVTTRQEVMSKYQLVFKHDRAGRLVDAQEFEHLEFERRRFAPDLLDELVRTAAHSVTLTEDCVSIKHLYIERRLTPLDVYIREADEIAARRGVIEYGQAIKDLAATNIFPGDLLLKNFGVTRHGRVVFYDYDELCFVTDCAFHPLPRSTDLDEMGAEPWFYVGERDIFPEEFINFMGLTPRLRETFLQAHADLLAPEYWERVRERHLAGEIMDIFPYRPERRLQPGA